MVQIVPSALIGPYSFIQLTAHVYRACSNNLSCRNLKSDIQKQTYCLSIEPKSGIEVTAEMEWTSLVVLTLILVTGTLQGAPGK